MTVIHFYDQEEPNFRLQFGEYYFETYLPLNKLEGSVQGTNPIIIATFHRETKPKKGMLHWHPFSK